MRHAIICGGSLTVLTEFENANKLCIDNGIQFSTFVTNDTIGLFRGSIDYAVTLHPDKLAEWLARRRLNKYPMPAQIWGHRPHRAVNKNTTDWGGSSGLFMFKVARETGHDRIIACGVPMSPEHKHIIRTEKWNAALSFRRAWDQRRTLIIPYFRSMSGWTKETFGEPTAEWLKS